MLRKARLFRAASRHTLLPNKPFIIRAELNESYLAGVKVGMKAKVQIDNDSERKDLPTAHVIRISSTFVLSQLQENAQQSPRRVVECILAFDSEPSTLVGQNVVVSFMTIRNVF